MIFITVGTTNFPFQRLSNIIFSLAQNELRTEPLIFQHGATKISWKLPNVKFYRFLAYKTHTKFITKAKLIISHGGHATIYLALSLKKNVIVLPRQKNYGEHVNDHQVFFSEYLARQNLIKLLPQVKSIDTFRSKAANYTKQNRMVAINRLLDSYIQS